MGFRRLGQAFCPASAFVSADRYEARNPQRFIHVTDRAQYASLYGGYIPTSWDSRPLLCPIGPGNNRASMIRNMTGKKTGVPKRTVPITRIEAMKPD